MSTKKVHLTKGTKSYTHGVYARTEQINIYDRATGVSRNWEKQRGSAKWVEIIPTVAEKINAIVDKWYFQQVKPTYEEVRFMFDELNQHEDKCRCNECRRAWPLIVDHMLKSDE